MKLSNISYFLRVNSGYTVIPDTPLFFVCHKIRNNVEISIKILLINLKRKHWGTIMEIFEDMGSPKVVIISCVGYNLYISLYLSVKCKVLTTNIFLPLVFICIIYQTSKNEKLLLFPWGESGFWKACQSMFPNAVTYSVSTQAYLIWLFYIRVCQRSSCSVNSKAKVMHISETT